ncbi:MAG: copper resistance protein [Hyphomicrobiales bacterium]|nr:copper resistance protein [Hyphomicrobiales bacterium]MBV9112248.1 copper resistance protein [Hyphomicrobiales bacterium]MBV9517112.1 copper resistance protein [Hyphomicrobiales bacterium]
MKRYPFARMVISAAFITIGLAPAMAATTVKVEMQDPSTDEGTKSMQMKLDRDSVPAGQVRFEATNESKTLVHEMILVKTDQDPSAFPYDSKKEEVIEAKVKSLGEVPELQPGKSGHLTVSLRPGSYVLYCNQAAHMHQGMWARLTVTAK